MMSELILRAATEADVEDITAIYNQVITSSNAVYRENEVDTSERLAWFRDKIENGYVVIVAQLVGEIVGYGVFGAFRFGEGYNATVEHSVHVKSESRGQGIGKAILEALIAKAKLQNRRIMVAAIDSANEVSIALHLANGFIETARMPQIAQKNGEFLNLVLLQKTL